MKKALFVCVENAGRSQMAEAFARRYGEGRIEASSAGTAPARGVNPVVVEAMREKGYDLSGSRPKAIDPAELLEADVVVTMGCGAEGFCPAHMLDRVVDWGIDDPKGMPLEEVRRIRDEIEGRVRALIDEIAPFE